MARASTTPPWAAYLRLIVQANGCLVERWRCYRLLRQDIIVGAIGKVFKLGRQIGEGRAGDLIDRYPTT